MRKQRSRAGRRKAGGPGPEDTVVDGLTVLTGYLELLRRETFGPLTPRQLEIVEGLTRTVDVLVKLVGPAAPAPSWRSRKGS